MMIRSSCLALLLLFAAPVPHGAGSDAAVEDSVAAAEDAAAQAADAAGPEDARDADEAEGEIDEVFSPTEKVPADASIRFPVDI